MIGMMGDPELEGRGRHFGSAALWKQEARLYNNKLVMMLNMTRLMRMTMLNMMRMMMLMMLNMVRLMRMMVKGTVVLLQI